MAPPSPRQSWRARLLLFLAVVGPGFITANVDNDAGGIFTYSLAGAQFVERRQIGQRLDAGGVEGLLAEATTKDHELVVGLGEFRRDLGGGDGILRRKDHGRALEQVGHVLEFGADESQLGEAVLRDLDGATGSTNLTAKRGHVRHGEPRVLRDHNGPSRLELDVEGSDEFALFRSFHDSLIPFDLGGGSNEAGCRGHAVRSPGSQVTFFLSPSPAIDRSTRSKVQRSEPLRGWSIPP